MALATSAFRIRCLFAVDAPSLNAVVAAVMGPNRMSIGNGKYAQIAKAAANTNPRTPPMTRAEAIAALRRRRAFKEGNRPPTEAAIEHLMGMETSMDDKTVEAAARALCFRDGFNHVTNRSYCGCESPDRCRKWVAYADDARAALQAASLARRQEIEEMVARLRNPPMRITDGQAVIDMENLTKDILDAADMLARIGGLEE